MGAAGSAASARRRAVRHGSGQATHGVVVNRTSENVIRMLPPYVITEAELDEGLARLEKALIEILGKGSAA